LVFQVVSFLLAFPPIFYMHSSSPPFVLHAPPIEILYYTRIIVSLVENALGHSSGSFLYVSHITRHCFFFHHFTSILCVADGKACTYQGIND
jgi:hypothetical protein